MGAGVVVVVVVVVVNVGVVEMVVVVVVTAGVVEMVVAVCGKLEVVVGCGIVMFQILAFKKAVVPEKKNSTTFILNQILFHNKIIW